MNIKDASVIVVEDNPDNLMLTTEMLRIAGARYINARASGRQLFKLLESGVKPDLILLDIHIPREDGYVIAQRIRAHPTLRDVKVVALTANVMPEDVNRAREAGFDGFIGKPIMLNRFPLQLASILSGDAVWEP